MAGRMDPTAAAAKWANNLGNSVQAIQAGVEAVRIAPGQAAARQQQAYITGVQANVQKWATRVAAVSLADWQQATISKGIQRIASGAQAAQPKFAAFAAKFFPFLQGVVNNLPPRGTLDQNINRMVQLVRGVSAYGKAG